MNMTYAQLLKASQSDIQTIRKQPESYCRKALTPAELDELWNHLNVLYENNVQRGFAQRIYMKAEQRKFCPYLASIKCHVNSH